MTTMNQARAALAVAQKANTKAQWQAAALALAAVLASAPVPAPVPAVVTVLNPPTRRPRRRNEGGALDDPPHKGKTPIRHVLRCTLADGFSVRLSIGQHKGETRADCVARMIRLATDIWRSDETCRRLGVGRGYPVGLAFNAMFATIAAPAVIECRIVKHGTGPRAGLDLEVP